MTESKHPNRNDLYTPITPEFIGLLERMRDEVGSWRLVAARVPMRMKVLRNIRKGKERRAVSQTTVDKMCTATGVGSVLEFEWFTADDLVALGIWKRPVSIHEQPKNFKSRAEKHAARLERARLKRRAARRKKLGLPE